MSKEDKVQVLVIGGKDGVGEAAARALVKQGNFQVAIVTPDRIKETTLHTTITLDKFPVFNT